VTTLCVGVLVGVACALVPLTTAAASLLKRSSVSLAGIPQSNETLGSSRAPLKMLYFNSPSSPISQEWQSNVFPTLVRKYVRTGKLQIQWHGIDVIEPPTVPGDRFVAAAGLQNHLWDVLDDVMANQGRYGTDWLTPTLLERVGAAIPGFNVAAAIAAASTPGITHELAVDEQQADKDRVSGVPEFRLGRRGGPLRRFEYAEQTPKEFERPINDLLQKRKQ
jgi:protein-disulfide isomerase